MKKHKIDLVCPAGSYPAFRAAVDNGADAVYIGFRDATNARNFPGLNFDIETAKRAITYARNNNCKVLLAMNTYPLPQQWNHWTSAVDAAVDVGVDAIILADTGLLQYCTEKYPALSRHLSVQSSATNPIAIQFYYRHFEIKRVILPRVLSLRQVKQVIEAVPVEVEIFGFGSLCVMVEGRCIMSSYVTGQSPNSAGVCSPASSVQWLESAQGRQAKLNEILIDCVPANKAMGYPTLCKGRFNVRDKTYYAIEEPTSLNILPILPQLIEAGVSAIKVEGRQRSPAYVAKVTQVLRQALDSCELDAPSYKPKPQWTESLDRLSEGQTHTLGALHRSWQ